MDGIEIIGSVAGISGGSFVASWAVTQYRIKVIEKRIELDKKDHIEALRHQSEERKKAVIEITQLVNEKVVERKKETDAMKNDIHTANESYQKVMVGLAEAKVESKSHFRETERIAKAVEKLAEAISKTQ